MIIVTRVATFDMTNAVAYPRKDGKSILFKVRQNNITIRIGVECTYQEFSLLLSKSENGVVNLCEWDTKVER